ncbi:MAG TPA: FHA domain-containing protein, partial [Burkholderiaceae bacterium]|nr:FHA domain-containing protein [Burkholderiaceae bacterium]
METLALIEVLDREGFPRQSVRIAQWPARIGRAVDCDLVLDDPHVAPHHASLIVGDGGVHVVPSPTINGVRFGRARVAMGSAPRLPPSGMLTLGSTTVRVRLADEALAPELPLTSQMARGSRV